MVVEGKSPGCESWGELWVSWVMEFLWKCDLLVLQAFLCYFLQAKRHQRLVLALAGS